MLKWVFGSKAFGNGVFHGIKVDGGKVVTVTGQYVVRLNSSSGAVLSHLDTGHQLYVIADFQMQGAETFLFRCYYKFGLSTSVADLSLVSYTASDTVRYTTDSRYSDGSYGIRAAGYTGPGEFHGTIAAVGLAQNPLNNRLFMISQSEIAAVSPLVATQTHWVYRPPSANQTVCATLAPSKGLYVADAGNFLRLFDQFSGSIIASVALGASAHPRAPPVLSANEQTLFVVDMTGGVHALRSTDLARLWVYNVSALLDSPPVLGPGNTLLVCSNDYRLYALDRTSGALLWTFSTGE